MKKNQRLWTREELMLAINLYAKLPFGKMDHRNKEVQQLAILINRTSDAVARKLGNFASLDPVQIRDNGQKVGSNPLKPLSVLALRQMKGYE